MTDDLVKNLDALTAGAAASLNTQANRVLPAPAPVVAIPARVGTGQPKRPVS